MILEIRSTPSDPTNDRTRKLLGKLTELFAVCRLFLLSALYRVFSWLCQVLVALSIWGIPVVLVLGIGKIQIVVGLEIVLFNREGVYL